jgi:hypothetical protein
MEDSGRAGRERCKTCRQAARRRYSQPRTIRGGKWTGVSCCTAPGQRQFRLTTAGCPQIGGTSGLGYVSLVLGRRARGRSPLGSIALDPLARVNWDSSRAEIRSILQGQRASRVHFEPSIGHSDDCPFLPLPKSFMFAQSASSIRFEWTPIETSHLWNGHPILRL